MAWRNRRFDRRPPRSVSRPVISVGNLTVGGTGKTPLVGWLAEQLQSAGYRPAIVSRGYGGSEGRLNDEGRELARRLPDVPQTQSADRYVAAREAIETYRAELLILDDGFQHRRLARQVDIVLIDALCPWGYDHLLPRGLLREPLRGLARAHAVVLTRSGAVDATTREAIRRRAVRLAPHALWCTATESATRLVDCDGNSFPLTQLAGQRAAAFCGIGNPRAFRATIESCRTKIGQGGGKEYEGELQLVGWRTFADHHPYDADDGDELGRWAARQGADCLLCTEKDLVKIPHRELEGVPLYGLRIAVHIEPEKELIRLVLQHTGIGEKRPAHPPCDASDGLKE